MNGSQQLFKTAAEVANDQAQLQLQAASQAFLPINNNNNNNSIDHSSEQQRKMALLSLFNSLSSLANSSSSNNINNNQQQQFFQQQQNQKKEPPSQITGQCNGQQRINYCTICNKELCNKYFMKTHMLKMHGINLEMDTSQNGSDDDNNNQNPNDIDDTDQSDQPEDCSLAGQQQQQHQMTNNNSGNNWKKRKESSQSSSQGSNSSTSKSAANSNKQATSVMNGFAGNSMGGVICDICNKELCSKYFLKVHKQNTHGISTDNYHDSTPFAAIYPFAAAASLPGLALPVGLMAAAAAAQSPFGQPPGSSANTTTTSNSNNLFNHCTDRQQPRSSPVKKARLGQQHVIESKVAAEPAVGGQLESLYRLMLAQKTHQEQQQQQHSVHQQPPQPMEDPMAAAAMAATAAAAMNPLNALMCFGGAQQAFMSPAATLSPAMIVDQILRNQHLFSQQKQQQQQQQQQQHQNNSSNSKQADRNNNSNSAEPTTNKQKANANKRYFSHYTEACLMCDRRFKSIKWLKTHMMNDHKHEIGAYLQSMMQYLYAQNKSHQMAAIEQQQQHQHHQHQLQAAALFQHQQYSAQLQSSHMMNVFNQQQQRQFNPLTPQAYPVEQQQQYQNHRADFIFDARCSNNSRASLSPVDSFSSQQLNIKREALNSCNSPQSAAHHPNRQAGSSSSLTAHDLSAGEPSATSLVSDCGELLNSFEQLADDRRTETSFPSPSPSSSPGPTLALDSRSHSKLTASPPDGAEPIRQRQQTTINDDDDDDDNHQ